MSCREKRIITFFCFLLAISCWVCWLCFINDWCWIGAITTAISSWCVTHCYLNLNLWNILILL